MDRDTVRVVCVIIGILMIAGVVIWWYFKEPIQDLVNRLRGDGDPGGGLADLREPSQTAMQGRHGYSTKPDNSDPHIIPADGDEEEADDLELNIGISEDGTSIQDKPASREGNLAKESASLGAPFLIQLSVMSADRRFFDGELLRDALEDLELVHGDMGIYHRYDHEYREPQFSVASLVEPGTFPVEHMASFRCPGVVLFFQPSQVANPLAVYDDLITTCHALADKLGATEWDEVRKPLTEDKIDSMRERLREAC